MSLFPKKVEYPFKSPEDNLSGFAQKYEAAQLFSTLIIIRNAS